MFPECSTLLEVQSYKEFRNIIKVMRVVCSRHAGIAVTPPFPHFHVFLEVALTELYVHYNNQRGPVWICHFTASNLNPSNHFYSLLSLESFTAQKLGKICYIYIYMYIPSWAKRIKFRVSIKLPWNHFTLRLRTSCPWWDDECSIPLRAGNLFGVTNYNNESKNAYVNARANLQVPLHCVTVTILLLLILKIVYTYYRNSVKMWTHSLFKLTKYMWEI